MALSQDEIDAIEEDLEFQQILIDSLDIGSDDYADRRAELEEKKYELERRLGASQGGSRPQTAHSHSQMNGMAMNGMGGSYDQSNAFWQATLNGRPGSNGGYSGTSPFSAHNTQPHSMKRPLPPALRLDSEHPSKRPTPEPSNAGTPTSSVDSFEFIENPTPELAERARRRQLAAEAAIARQNQAQVADAEYARNLSQQHQPRASSSSSMRPGVQTTLNHNGSFQRPPPQVKPQQQPMAPPYSMGSNSFQFGSNPLSKQHLGQQPQPTYIKPEQSPARQQQSKQQHVQRPRTSTQVVDLTNSDSEDEDVSEVGPSSFTPSARAQRPAYNNQFLRAPGPSPAPAVQPVQRPMAIGMPGSFPMADPNGNQYVYGANPNSMVQQRYGWMQQANPIIQNALTGMRTLGSNLGNSFSDLNNLINGPSSRPGPQPIVNDDDDDDVIFGGYGQRQPAPLAGYDDHDLYQRRYDEIANYDPAKSAEEINALLENIRPDEDMPAHLRVQTPEAMTIKLHKYQELGLTWLQKCEDGTNKGGILADDMGLGKTIQMLSLIVTHKSEDPRCKTTLIVAPVALMRQWQQEIEQKIKPGRHRLSVFVQHGQSKKKNFADLQMYDIVLTTFGSLAAELKKLEKLRLRQMQFPDTRPAASEKCALISEDAEWFRVILDEAQCIKNDKSQTAKAACQLRAKFRFCMTGTPMMNNVQELYSLIRFLRIRPYADWTKFRMDFITPIKSGREEVKGKAMRMLQSVCKAIMLRRTKKSMFEGKPILVLPERFTEIDNPVFSEDETTFYKALETRSQLQFNKYLRNGTVGSSYSAILVLLLRLRQACCHPHLIKDFGVSATADVTQDELVRLAQELSPPVVARIKETNGNFECPVCYDAVTNPAIFIPCGHDTCSDCFARIADPANAIRDGNENGTGAKCPNCRGAIEPKRITDFDSFKKVHMPELLSAEEQEELKQLHEEVNGDDSTTDSDDSDSDTESEDEGEDVDAKGNLKGFIVNDDEDSETESEAGDADVKGDEGEGVAGPSTQATKSKGKGKSKKSKKAKGKKKEKRKKQKKAVTLAELKKLATRSAKGRKAYIRRLRADWITSAKIEKTLQTLKEIMDDVEGEKVLIFSQWTSLLDLLEVPIDNEGWAYRRYDGSMNAKMRGDAVDDFRDARKNVRIMLVSLKAGNAGLNLNMASQVIILDPFWNPYIEEQAIDRAHRIGQTREVKVHRMLIKGTVEDRIIELQEKKRALISEALDEKASQNIARLGVQELAYLFGVTHNPAQRVQYTPREAR